MCQNLRVYLGVRTCELFLCFVAIVRVRVIMLTSLFSLFYVTREFHRFLHRARAKFNESAIVLVIALLRKFISETFSSFETFIMNMAFFH